MSAARLAETLLLERECRALRWSAMVRIVFVSLASILVVPAAGRMTEAFAILGLCIAVLLVQVVILRTLRQDASAVTRTGWLAAVTDLCALCALPVIWHLVYTTDAEPLVHLSRHNLTAVSVALLAMNGIALRPVYPALLTVGAVSLHVLLAVLAVTDWRLDAFQGGIQRALGVGMSTSDMLYVTPSFVAAAGALVVLATRTVRSLVHEAVAREQAEHQLRRQQLEAVLDAKMAAVGDLVAGLEHEVNNPLGALRSATDTAEKAIARVRAGDGAQDERATRALTALERSVELTEQASGRIAEVMATIRGFVQLDRADLQRVDLADVVNTGLDVQKSAFRNDTKVATDLERGLTVEVDPNRLTAAITTVVRNAGEAFDAPGDLTLSLKADDGRARLTIRDTGRGMTPEKAEGLFEIDFAAGERTHARFGLALCRNIITRHGGTVTLESEPGVGTTVTVELPLA